MNISLKGKYALVCGSSKGIGRAIAKQLATHGATIIALARSEPLLKELMEELAFNHGQDHQYIVSDFAKPDKLKETISAFVEEQPIEILINNTGGPAGGPLIQADEAALIEAFRMHILTSHMLTGLVTGGMKNRGYGRIINVISTSVKEPINGLGVSNTIRGAMGNWSKTIANELGQYGITVNNILPGFTMTERLDSIIISKMEKMEASRETVEMSMKSTVPLRRFADPAEVAAAASFLASPAASYINGINLPVDGGRTKSL
jgi:3-oxoacyl-[acyl-carrier protein] reductase